MIPNVKNLGYLGDVVEVILRKVMKERIEKISQGMKIPKRIIYEIVLMNLTKLEHILRKDYNEKLDSIINTSKEVFERTNSTKAKRFSRTVIRESEQMKKKIENDYRI